MTDYDSMSDEDLDREVAEKVMGWKVGPNPYASPTDPKRLDHDNLWIFAGDPEDEEVVGKLSLFIFSLSISKAWAVIEWTTGEGCQWLIQPGIRVSCYGRNVGRCEGLPVSQTPRAICIAALRAKEE